MKVKVKFNLIKINQIAENKEIVFPYGDKWYRLDWDKVPDRFKELYVVWLKFQGLEIPNWLKDYERSTIDISNVSVEIDLNMCEEIPENYPIGV